MLAVPTRSPMPSVGVAAGLPGATGSFRRSVSRRPLGHGVLSGVAVREFASDRVLPGLVSSERAATLILVELPGPIDEPHELRLSRGQAGVDPDPDAPGFQDKLFDRSHH